MQKHHETDGGTAAQGGGEYGPGGESHRGQGPWHVFWQLHPGRPVPDWLHRLVQSGGHGQRRLLFHLCLPAHLERDLHRSDFGTRKASGEQPTELPILEIQGANGEFPSTLELEDLLERGERTATGVVKKGIQAMRLRVNGYSTREIGVHLGAPDNYVTAWEAKARKYLRAMN